jgi:gluconolactonase
MKRATVIRAGVAAASLCLAAGVVALAPPSRLAVAQPAAAPAVERIDPALDALVAADAKVEKVAGGFKFTESPLWRRQGALWFSDLVANIVHQWTPDGKVAEVLNPGGYDGHDLPEGSYLGPNGMTPGPGGTLTLCQHGNRRIVSVTADKKITVLVDNYEGKKLNSPNDVVYAPDGSLYFTDPPFGLPKRDDDPAKELKFNGVFRLAKGKLQLLIQDIPTPNGIAFSPDYKTLYVSNSQQGHRLWKRYDVTSDGGVANGRMFLDASDIPNSVPGTADGMKVDVAGNIYATGPGGIWVISPAGKRLGVIHAPEVPSAVAFGDADGKTLYITARTSVYRIRVKIAGMRPVYY